MLRRLLIASTILVAGCQTTTTPDNPTAGQQNGAASPAGSSPTAAPSPAPAPVASDPSARIDNIIFQVSPSPLHLENGPQPDGIEARVMLFRNDVPSHSVTSTGGTIEFYMFDGQLVREQLQLAKPLAVWRFESTQLKDHQATIMVGPAYEFVLGWGRHVPKSRAVTIFSRYTLPGRNPVEAPLIVVVVFP